MTPTPDRAALLAEVQSTVARWIGLVTSDGSLSGIAGDRCYEAIERFAASLEADAKRLDVLLASMRWWEEEREWVTNLQADSAIVFDRSTIDLAITTEAAHE
jgi:Tfp pilus assembly protein PilN